MSQAATSALGAAQPRPSRGASLPPQSLEAGSILVFVYLAVGEPLGEDVRGASLLTVYASAVGWTGDEQDDEQDDDLFADDAPDDREV